jgi:hypothetical protein
MTVGARRSLAFAAGCLVGIGLGVITSSLVNYYAEVSFTLEPRGSGGVPPAPNVWAACMIIGAGLGVAAAAMIRKDS